MKKNKINENRIFYGKRLLYLALLAIIINIIIMIATSFTGDFDNYAKSGAIISLWLTLLFFVIGILLIVNEIIKKN